MENEKCNAVKFYIVLPDHMVLLAKYGSSGKHLSGIYTDSLYKNIRYIKIADTTFL